jgi:predicted site-specific integrase-resolvase
MESSFDFEIISLQKWLIQIGVSASTAWRWRRAGLLKTVNIYGRIYVTREARAEFLARAQSGEFAQEPVTPKRHER